MTTLTRTTHSPSSISRFRVSLGAAAAGVLFPISSFIQAALRPGFDLRHHGLSLLALGRFGWIQMATFVLSGLLALIGAVGWHQALRSGPGRRALPILLTICGFGMIGGGIFHPDPEYGFPAGAPAGAATVLSTGALLHTVAAIMAFESLTIACLVFTHRFWREGHRRLATYSAVSGIATFVISSPTWGWDSSSIRLAVATVVMFNWLTLISTRLARAS